MPKGWLSSKPPRKETRTFRSETVTAVAVSERFRTVLSAARQSRAREHARHEFQARDQPGNRSTERDRNSRPKRQQEPGIEVRGNHQYHRGADQACGDARVARPQAEPPALAEGRLAAEVTQIEV